MADSANEPDPRLVLRCNLGLEATARLTTFAQMIVSAWPTLNVIVFGSVLRRKDWRDIDVMIVAPSEHPFTPLHQDEQGASDCQQRFRLGAPYDVTAAAFSALAREMTGVPVEVRISGEPIAPFVLLAGEGDA